MNVFNLSGTKPDPVSITEKSIKSRPFLTTEVTRKVIFPNCVNFAALLHRFNRHCCNFNSFYNTRKEYPE